MADPRAAVSFEGISPVIATFKHDNTIVYDRTKDGNSAQVGLAVTLSTTDDTVTLVGNAERVLGKLLSVGPDGYCSVQISGGMTLPGGDAATLTIGTRIMGDLGLAAAEGYVQTEADAAPPVGRGWIINNNDTAAVQVIL